MSTEDVNSPLPLDYEEFMEGYNTLKYALGGKRSQVAKFLNRSPLTLRNWENDSTTPEEWWWRPLFVILTYIVLQELSSKLRTARGYHIDALNSRITAIRQRLQPLQDAQYHMPIRILDETEESRARRFLLRVMRRPNHPYKFTFIQQHAKDEGVNIRTLRRAADSLGVRKQRNGYQSPSYWSRPQEEYELAYDS